jgi:hypothetical protein
MQCITVSTSDIRLGEVKARVALLGNWLRGLDLNQRPSGYEPEGRSPQFGRGDLLNYVPQHGCVDFAPAAGLLFLKRGLQPFAHQYCPDSVARLEVPQEQPHKPWEEIHVAIMSLGVAGKNL